MYSWVKLGDVGDWCAAQYAVECAADFPVGAHVPSVSTDTRTLKPGELFVALRGERFDGHDHAEAAAAAGALAILAERPTGAKLPHLIVPDSLKALVAIGRNLRSRFEGDVIAITGSAGKSSTKEMVACLLGSGVVKSPASFNNLLGVSRTLTLVEDDTRYLVLEMGMNALGEIAELCENFDPRVGVITNIGDAHLGRLGSVENIYVAKKELFDHLARRPDSAVALNVGDAHVARAFASAFPSGAKRVTYGGADAGVSEIRLASARIDETTGGLSLSIRVRGETWDETIPLFGLHHAQNAMAAVAVCDLLGVPANDIRSRLRQIRPAAHRGEILRLSGDRLVIDESYNSNPTALRSSLESFSRIAARRRKVIVLGDMLELGEFERARHEEAGDFVARSFSEHPVLFVSVGARMRWAGERVERARGKDAVRYFSDVREAIPGLPALLKAGDAILVKSSRGGNLDLIVEDLVRDGPA